MAPTMNPVFWLQASRYQRSVAFEKWCDSTAERRYAVYVHWCKCLGMTPSDFDSWQRTVSEISELACA